MISSRRCRIVTENSSSPSDKDQLPGMILVGADVSSAFGPACFPPGQMGHRILADTGWSPRAVHHLAEGLVISRASATAVQLAGRKAVNGGTKVPYQDRSPERK